MQSIAIILTTWHLAFGTLITQVMARTTTMLDSRKNVKMNGRIYLRAIVPIGIFFSLSLICGNVTYLYLSVAFIQMLKASQVIKGHEKPASNCSTGNYPSSRPSYKMDSRPCPTKPQNPGKRLIHRYWSHGCLVRRDRFRPRRVPLPAGRRHFRSNPAGNGRASPELCRIQDGSPSFFLLLCPCLRHFQRNCRAGG